MNSDTPSWHLLPDDPRGFFGLPEDFDRLQLKRAYTTLLRRFKPDRFPDEFMRLRQAYETLLRELDAGGGPPPPAMSQQPPPPPAQPLPPLDGNQTPESLFRLLGELTSKKAEHYVMLACLSDLVEPDLDRRFGFWLLRGRSAFPRNELLERLWHRYWLSLGAADLVRLVSRMADMLAPADFYTNTLEPFCGLLGEIPFEEWKGLLYECESRLRGDRMPHRLVFMITVVRRAFWRAEEGWLAQFFDYINYQLHDLPDQLELELDFLEALWDYRAGVTSFLDGTPLRRKLHETIVACCDADWSRARELFVERAIELVDDGPALLAAFPAGSDIGPFFEVFHRLSLLLESDDEDTEMAWSPRIADYKIRHFLVQLGVLGDKDALTFFWSAANWLGWALILFMGLLLPLWFAFYFLAVLPGLAKLIVFGLGLWGVRHFLVHGPLQMWREQAAHWFTLKLYKKHWRPATLQFLRESYLDVGQVIDLLEKIEDETFFRRQYYLSWLRSDIAPWLYSVAQRHIA
ncbi:J domain-containing protein [Sulfidibacter corallicola]|uniref:J domain-containing protein n=1 Tax=Sulfidibacter corallicola TaxID=2818388 RepID=A0A8A4TRA6_SULCO|nr:J domain-containing protein [Sulfidibacter corallicola]QTD52499.1 J domain-containing protein [Sulfidibacter corallicola]